MNCGRCHTCGARLRIVLDGEEWCDTCGQYRRYRSHGWAACDAGNRVCPDWNGETIALWGLYHKDRHYRGEYDAEGTWHAVKEAVLEGHRNLAEALEYWRAMPEGGENSTMMGYPVTKAAALFILGY